VRRTARLINTSSSALRVAFSIAATLLASHRQTKLRDTANAHRHNDDRPRQSCDEERNSDWHVAAYREEVNPYVSGVLGNEVNKRDAKDDGDDHADPRGRRSSVTKVFPTVLGYLAAISGYVIARPWRRRLRTSAL
jgi:hypothetical protein